MNIRVEMEQVDLGLTRSKPFIDVDTDKKLITTNAQSLDVLIGLIKKA